MGYVLGAYTVTIDTVTVGRVVKCDIESLLGEEIVTQDQDTAERKQWTIKSGTASMEFMEDSSDGGQEDIQDDYDTPAFSEYIVIIGAKTYTFDAFPKSIKPIGTPDKNVRVQVTFGVSGGVATS